MRALALLLILANICYFFWSHYVDVPDAAPLATALPESKRPPRLVLATEQSQPADANAAAQAASELTCISVGPFATANELQPVTQRLQDAGFTATARMESGEVFAGYWVSLKNLATRADAEQALKRLQAVGITDAYIMPDDNSPPHVLSLGLFSEQPRAEQRLEAITKLGFAPTLENRMRPGETHWLDVALQEPGQLIEPTLLQPDAGGIVRLETRACPVVSAGSSSSESSQASSAASSAKAAPSKLSR